MLKRLLITGAAGGLGKMARQRLTHLAKVLRLSDIETLGTPATNEEHVVCDLADETAVDELVKDCDGILHLGGISVESSFDQILRANLQGIYHLYEAARQHGYPRILLASSNHTIGFHPQNRRLDAQSQLKPDGLYGVSKCFAESMASLYHDKFGQESALVRIGSCFPEPINHRMLATWMSPGDFVSLIECVFRVPRLGCPVIYGVSNNDEKWWDNSSVEYLGWHPRDNSEQFRAQLDANVSLPDPNSMQAIYQGGMFTEDPIYKAEK